MRAALGASRGAADAAGVRREQPARRARRRRGRGLAWTLVSLSRAFLPEAFLLRTLNPLNIDVRALVVTSASAGSSRRSPPASCRPGSARVSDAGDSLRRGGSQRNRNARARGADTRPARRRDRAGLHAAGRRDAAGAVVRQPRERPIAASTPRRDRRRGCRLPAAGVSRPAVPRGDRRVRSRTMRQSFPASSRWRGRTGFRRRRRSISFGDWRSRVHRPRRRRT